MIPLAEIPATMLPFSSGQRSWDSKEALDTICTSAADHHHAEIHPQWCADEEDPFCTLRNTAQRNRTYSILLGCTGID